MRAVVLTLLGLMVAATFAQPALAGRTDLVWLDYTVQTSGAGPQAQSAADPGGDYFFLAGETERQVMEGCGCAGCGAGPKAQPQKTDETKQGRGPAQTDSPWNF